MLRNVFRGENTVTNTSNKETLNHAVKRNRKESEKNIRMLLFKFNLKTLEKKRGLILIYSATSLHDTESSKYKLPQRSFFPFLPPISAPFNPHLLKHISHMHLRRGRKGGGRWGGGERDGGRSGGEGGDEGVLGGGGGGGVEEGTDYVSENSKLVVEVMCLCGKFLPSSNFSIEENKSVAYTGDLCLMFCDNNLVTHFFHKNLL
eukprot:CAMPEP_0201516806 /NCGR_PEP_ID=MMETSP0161_2-20130828/8061_1 /ASSEMBLY_ACC=CAM_ASM_000251 /TAXON_ID=180227 /ORGANISM="Neoparamoeba aestuarina, Strain SoJaBio B1-5/56/2" /LENGTH=203 /DNA_ID=CAMNT_0047914089 /DNA_START=434 /DNA_END=1045 /DNA_ORIENTATION=-